MNGFNRFKSLGFTLVELMIVVVIISVLAAISIPAYQNYVYKSRRADAKSALLKIQLAEEKWRANHTTYTAALTDLGYTGSSPYYSPDSHYTLGISNATATTYTLTATATGIQEADTHCAKLSIDQTGTKSSEDHAGNVTTSNSDCW